MLDRKGSPVGQDFTSDVGLSTQQSLWLQGGFCQRVAGIVEMGVPQSLTHELPNGRWQVSGSVPSASGPLRQLFSGSGVRMVFSSLLCFLSLRDAHSRITYFSLVPGGCTMAGICQNKSW